MLKTTQNHTGLLKTYISGAGRREMIASGDVGRNGARDPVEWAVRLRGEAELLRRRDCGLRGM